jgi:uncharacterized protein (TIGR02466 family)
MTQKNGVKYEFYYWGPLLFRTHINPEELKEIKKLCKKDPTKSYVKNLAGDIKDEYLIDKDKLNNILIPYIDTFKYAHEHWYAKPVSDLKVVASWVNYMEPGDYNPPHTHNNCNFSGVIYVDIPKQLKKEIKEYEGRSKGPGAITFMYGEENDQAITCRESNPIAGDFYMFPNKLRHMVNPHKSKCERVSIGVNFTIKGDKI